MFTKTYGRLFTQNSHVFQELFVELRRYYSGNLKSPHPLYQCSDGPFCLCSPVTKYKKNHLGWWFYVSPALSLVLPVWNALAVIPQLIWKWQKSQPFCLERRANREELDSCRRPILFLILCFLAQWLCIGKTACRPRLLSQAIFVKRHVWLIWCCIADRSLSAARLIYIDWA